VASGQAFTSQLSGDTAAADGRQWSMRRSRTLTLLLAATVLLTGACASSDDGDAEPTRPDDSVGGTDDTDGSEEPGATAPTIAELLERDGTLLVAHAGGDRDAPQETMYAYTRAVEAGSDVLELDVMLTADDQLVVHHDATVDRLTDGSGAVGELTLEEIQELDAAHWWAPGCTNGTCRDLPADDYDYRGIRTGEVEAPEGFTAEDFRIPTFREVAEAFVDLPLDVEIKGDGEAAHAAVEVLADELESLERIESTIVASFDASTVERMRERLPDVAVSPGLSTMTDWVLGQEPLEGYDVVQIPPSYDDIDLLDLVLERAEAEGVVVWVWPSDADAQENAEYYEMLIDRGVGAVIAGSPAVWPG
jgi:glycerophosphoryl diester phosphodiesterase